LRGTRFDVFGYTRERRTERQLIAGYERLMEELVRDLSPANFGIALQLASIPEQIRGFGHVKQRHVEHARRREAELLAAFREAKLASAGESREPSAAMVK
jgi:indolepyruvate ferredoxin oxidoreductase